MNKITLLDLEKWGCCYRPGDSMWDDVIEPYLRNGRTPLEVANARRFSVRDRIWVLLREEVLGVAGVDSVTSGIVDYVVRQHCLHCGISDVEAWAREWLSGEDRSALSALSASQSIAGSAWSAAWPTAESAWSAAWPTAESAWSAAWPTAESTWSAVRSAGSAALSAAESAARYARYAESAAQSAWSAARSALYAEEKRQLGIIKRYLKKKKEATEEGKI